MSTANGYRNARNTGTMVNLVVGLVLVGAFAGCMAISRSLPDPDSPGLKAMASDLERVRDHRCAVIFSDGEYKFITNPPIHPGSPVLSRFPEQSMPADIPEEYDVLAHYYDDFTGDGIPEMAMLVWRPWREQPYMKWSERSGPMKDCQDENGYSCHVILIDLFPDPDQPRDGGGSYSHIWAGSPLPVPQLDLLAGDIDGDSKVELVTMRGDYKTGREGRGNGISIWQWTGFGFEIEYDSMKLNLEGIALEDINSDGVADIIGW